MDNLGQQRLLHYSDKDHQWKKTDEEMNIYLDSKNLPTKIVTLQWKYLTDTTVIKVNIINNGTKWHHVTFDKMPWEAHNYFCISPAKKMQKLNLIVRNYLKNPNWWEFYKMNGLSTLKILMLWKTKKGWGKI